MKRYSPSGYTIINLGEFADGDSLDDYPNNDDFKVLRETLKRIGTTGIIEKPFLITGHETSTKCDFQAIPSCYIKRSETEITNVILDFNTLEFHLHVDYNAVDDTGDITIL